MKPGRSWGGPDAGRSRIHRDWYHRNIPVDRFPRGRGCPPALLVESVAIYGPFLRCYFEAGRQVRNKDHSAALALRGARQERTAGLRRRLGDGKSDPAEGRTDFRLRHPTDGRRQPVHQRTLQYALVGCGQAGPTLSAEYSPSGRPIGVQSAAAPGPKPRSLLSPLPPLGVRNSGKFDAHRWLSASENHLGSSSWLRQSKSPSPEDMPQKPGCPCIVSRDAKKPGVREGLAGHGDRPVARCGKPPGVAHDHLQHLVELQALVDSKAGLAQAGEPDFKLPHPSVSLVRLGLFNTPV